MIFLRIIACYLFVMALMTLYVWQNDSPDAVLIFLLFIIGFIPSLFCTIFVLITIEIYFMRCAMGIGRFAATLVAGAVMPIFAIVVIYGAWDKIPQVFNEAGQTWSKVGVCWALLWYISSWVFPTRWTPDIDDLT